MNQPISTCSAASEGLPLDLKAQDSEPSLSAKSTRLPPEFSKDYGRIVQTLETSERLSAPSFCERMADQMSLREACLASLQAFSDKCAELLTSAGCGPKQSDWFANYDPASRSLRTRQASLFSKEGELGTELCLNWSRAGTIVNGMYFPQPRLVQGICGNASSLSVPTMDTQPERKNAGANAKKWNGNNSVGSLAKVVLLPTPRASANETRQTITQPSTEEGRHGKALQATVIANLLPTLRAGKHTSEDEASWKARAEAGKVSTPPLILAVKMGMGEFLPTVTARDYKDTPGMATEAENRNRTDQLPRRIYADESTALTGGMRLTPEFQCWLMGFPAVFARTVRDVSGTLSCHRSRKPSREQFINNSLNREMP